MLNLLKKDDARPICPHCQEELGQVWFRELSGVAGRRYVYFCSVCRKVLGISHRKGFLMG
jgi:hypothetical protein